MLALVRLTPVAVAAALGLAPQAADPCSEALNLGPTQPSDGAIDVPTNALLYIDASGVAGWGIVVEATDGSGRMSRTQAVALSDNLARAPLALRPGQVVALDVFAPMNNALRHSLRLRVGATEDHTPPGPIAPPTLSVGAPSINPCTNIEMRFLRVTVTPPADAATPARIEARGMSTILFRMAPGAAVPLHEHTDIE